jgi:hypothetical protein
MARVVKSAEELRALVLVEAIIQPGCPREIDVVIRRDLTDGWTAQILLPDPLTSEDCARLVGAVVQRLRREYELNSSEL